jgi:hypothetical protein
MRESLFLLLLLLLGSPLLAQSDAAYQKAATRLDKIIDYGLKKNKKYPTRRIDDYAFARRVYLDAIGRIPTYNELAAFKKNASRNKRNELIDKLIDSEGYVSHSYNFMADMLRIKGVPRFNSNNYSEYIKESLRKNKPYDEFVRELVSSNGLGYKPGNGAAGYYLRDRGMLLDNLAMTMKVFLGTSMECAQCHDHPYDRWSQMDFYKLAAFTSGTKMVISSKNNVKVKGLPRH